MDCLSPGFCWRTSTNQFKSMRQPSEPISHLPSSIAIPSISISGFECVSTVHGMQEIVPILSTKGITKMHRSSKLCIYVLILCRIESTRNHELALSYCTLNFRHLEDSSTIPCKNGDLDNGICICKDGFDVLY